MNILIIEDDIDISEHISRLLKRENYTTSLASDGTAGLEKAWDSCHDLILLDIMLPFMSGLEVLQEIREAGIDTPVLMLTARGDLDDRVQGLDLGADDYLAKPFSSTELLARVRALLRRGKTANPILSAGELRLNTTTRDVTNSGEVVCLTTKEFSLLEILLYNKGRAVSRMNLAEHVWGEEFDLFNMSNFISVHIKNLRKKIALNGQDKLITTVRGFGYKLVE